MSARLWERFRPHRTHGRDWPIGDPRRLARGIALVAESARALGFENGLAGKDRRGLCLYEDHEFQRDDPPHEAIVAAYRAAWARGSARAMGSRSSMPVAPAARASRTIRSASASGIDSIAASVATTA